MFATIPPTAGYATGLSRSRAGTALHPEYLIFLEVPPDTPFFNLSFKLYRCRPTCTFNCPYQRPGSALGSVFPAAIVMRQNPFFKWSVCPT